MEYFANQVDENNNYIYSNQEEALRWSTQVGAGHIQQVAQPQVNVQIEEIDHRRHIGVTGWPMPQQSPPPPGDGYYYHYGVLHHTSSPIPFISSPIGSPVYPPYAPCIPNFAPVAATSPNYYFDNQSTQEQEPFLPSCSDAVMQHGTTLGQFTAQTRTIGINTGIDGSMSIPISNSPYVANNGQLTDPIFKKNPFPLPPALDDYVEMEQEAIRTRPKTVYGKEEFIKVVFPSLLNGFKESIKVLAEIEASEEAENDT